MKILIPLYILILATLATTSWLARADGHKHTLPAYDMYGNRTWWAPTERRQPPQSSFGSYDSQGRWRNGEYRNWGPSPGCWVSRQGEMRCP